MSIMSNQGPAKSRQRCITSHPSRPEVQDEKREGEGKGEGLKVKADNNVDIASRMARYSSSSLLSNTDEDHEAYEWRSE